MWDDDLLRVAEELRATGERLRPFLEEQCGIAAQAIRNALAPTIERLQHAFDDMPARQKGALRTLASNGWYIDPDMPVGGAIEVAERFESDAGGAHAELCAYFTKRLDTIEAAVASRFTNRAHLLAPAFEAHRNGDYALSVPVFLAQADGICKDLVGAQLYAQRGGAPQLAAHLSLEDESEYAVSLLCPLLEPSPLTANRAARAGMTNLLNRHAILHGEALDYDTELNSFRAVSLIAFIAWALSDDSGEAG